MKKMPATGQGASRSHRPSDVESNESHRGRFLRCAIYTRKSSEEGLEQSFNSIDAQREACESYITSQRHEGWKVLPTRYDDGGFSGGTLERPAVQRLLADIQSGRVDLVVVYKIDRLTRSLADFAKMVEIFDANNASFVSVTQHFNTTTSMGRLTLNVLLSFAQFEREVTGERIRDKIAASKKKGMWMGGGVPLGYDVVDRKLVVNPEEAQRVNTIYERYLAVRDMRTLQAELQRLGIVGKQRTSRIGNTRGGTPMSRGALYVILKNRLYLGEVVHKDNIYPGEHPAILTHDRWQAVQEQLQQNSDARKLGTKAKESSLLAGFVFDSHYQRLIPSHSTKQGKRYRYYIARPEPDETGTWAPKLSIPAHDLETTVTQAIVNWLTDVPTLMGDMQLKSCSAPIRQHVLYQAERLAKILESVDTKALRHYCLTILCKVKVDVDHVEIELQRQGLKHLLGAESAKGTDTNDSRDEDPSVEGDGQNDVDGDDGERDIPSSLDNPRIRVEARLQRCGLEMRLVVLEDWAKVESPRLDRYLITAIARANRWLKQLLSGEGISIAQIAKAEKVSEGHIARTLRCAYLAPDIVEAVLSGTAPPTLTLRKITKDLPLSWEEQRKMFKMPLVTQSSRGNRAVVAGK